MELLNETAEIVNNGISQFTFNATDYTVFVFMLLISFGIGVYFGFFAKGADTTDEYLMGGKRMKTIPIAISLVASQLSGISIMTIPSEMYSFGINWCFNVISMLIVVPILCYVVIPVFYNNNISNCYEYLEIRFNRKTRQIQTMAFIVTLFLMLPVFIFIPALAFSQVTGINIHLINTIVCSICVFYTMFGGIKAVVWTDVVQAFIMVTSVVLVGILATVKIGGIGEVYHIAKAGGRLNINLAFDLTTRSTLWNCFISGTLMWASYVGLNQSCVQRIVSLPSLGHAKRSLVIFGFGFILILGFNTYTGIAMYSRYHDCDPIQAGFVQKTDKLMPYFVQDIVGHLKGMPGVFISCVFSAALSTMSASLNSLSGIVYFDYIKPYIRHTESRANLIMKVFVFVTGIYCILGGAVVEKFSSILQMVYSIGGVTFGSVFGVFMLGMLVPRAHGRAAFWSVVASMLAMLVIILGAQGRIHYKTLPLTLDGCEELNKTIASTTSTLLHSTQHGTNASEGFNIFDLSFNWYVVVGAIILFVVGIPLSYIIPPEKDEKFNPKLLSPILQYFMKYELTNVEEMPEILTKTNLKQ
ncbi:sodium-coupled monocarboxylate transporter 1-like [Teleopsis dalmanni]|uniref:sodium-coupled monocarboxylate transporter 1-like n=1 Tax=Teleopsis dalmanni TaxID=139649 RepID=UPI0018CE6836|nr:sodium-coupled monocarboxylate transporter 1-like [Teleopsis dalmanni]